MRTRTTCWGRSPGCSRTPSTSRSSATGRRPSAWRRGGRPRRSSGPSGNWSARTPPPEYRWRTLLLHATALEQDGRAEDAERAYLALVDELPASQQADALFRAGQLAYQAGRYAEAAETFGRIVLAHSGSPRAPQALYAQADASLLAGQPAAAAERFSRYLELFPSGPLAGAALRRLPFLYLSMEEFASAAQWADAALEEGRAADLAARLLQVKGEAALQARRPGGRGHRADGSAGRRPRSGRRATGRLLPRACLPADRSAGAGAGVAAGCR